MNLNDNPTTDQLRELLRGCDDRAGYHVLWVSKDGEVHITLIGEEATSAQFQREHPDAQLHLRDFAPGYDYVGPGAANDPGWVDDVFSALSQSWPGARGKPVAVAVEDW